MNPVAGGKCDKRLGDSMIEYNILGCAWSAHLEQKGFEMLHQSVPAHILEVQITNILNDGEPVGFLDHFTEGPIIHTVNLLDTETAENVIGEEIKERKDKQGSSGIPNPNSATNDFGGTSNTQIEDTEKLKESVRFQYDGKMIMKVTLKEGDDLKDCEHYTQTEDPDVTQSFHVLDYMKTFAVNVQLRYELIAPVGADLGVYCDMVDEDKVKIQIESNIGMDDATGFLGFWNQLDSLAQTKLALCSTMPPPEGEASGPCLITPVNENGNYAGKKNNLFVTGRPYPVGTSTRFMLFKVLGVDEDVRHTSEFFIQGLFTKGPGSSFALPTHEPILVLRDPPGKFCEN